jgi:hypothetical protein
LGFKTDTTPENSTVVQSSTRSRLPSMSRKAQFSQPAL